MAKIFIKTFGCSLNQSDSLQLAGLLKKENYEIIDKEEEANLVILNSCIVKEPTERALFKEIKKLEKTNKKIIIAGCLPQTNPEKLKDCSFIGTRNLEEIGKVVRETLENKISQKIKKEGNPELNLPKVRKNKIIEIIPVSRGCLGACSFCLTKAARGNLYSYKIKEIVCQVEKAVNSGAKEIWLTSQDCGCYGLDQETNLIDLLEELAKIKKDFKIRIGMMNPQHLLKILNDLIGIYQNDKIFKFLHLPVQSGNSQILKLMQRNYLVEDFKKIVKEFRKAIPQITISTDLICGFPHEGEKEFNDSLKLIKEIKPGILNISRFWPRPKTLAAKMKQTPSWIIKERSRRLTKLFKEIALRENKKWLNWQGEVLIDEKGKNNTFIGRNFAYKQIILEGNFKLGDKVMVKIEGASPFDLKGIKMG